jgi:hypothetical protein
LSKLEAEGKDRESRRWLEQGSKNISFFFTFVNFPATLNYTPAFDLKRISPLVHMAKKMSNNRCLLFTKLVKLKIK